MSTRERWIVYPLLFLSLGMVYRNAMHHYELCTCEELRIVGSDGEPRITLKTTPTGGLISVLTDDSHEVIVGRAGGPGSPVLVRSAKTGRPELAPQWLPVEPLSASTGAEGSRETSQRAERASTPSERR